MNQEQNGTFGPRLRRLREAAGLTQEELASRAGLTAKAVSALERGERKRPYPHTVRSLAEALQLSEQERTVLTEAVPSRDGDSPEAAVTPMSTLPSSLTPLLGREREVEEIDKLLRRAAVRLLTLTGPGGIGKTRLVTEVARMADGDFPDGVAFVALAPLGDAALVMPTVSQVLGLREVAGVHPIESLRQHLREKTFLLVLDNFEHVAEAAPEVVDLLGSCPNLSVLVTSRAPLRVRGEREYSVSSLAVPDPTRLPEADEVARTPAAELFVERAEEASPSFELTEANAASVAAICWRLDGLPLALELAAAQTRFLGPTALLSRLDRALEAGGARDLPERQRTMRSTLDWSHDLLHEPEKELFRRLSAFAGGFTLETAEDVGAAGSVEAEDVFVLLGNLVEQSLVVVETTLEGRTRYRMLEPVRQYALERLRESGEADEARKRHVRHFLALAEQAEPHIKGLDQATWLDRLETENDNLRAAIGWSIETGDAQSASRFGWVLSMYWVMRSRHSEGRLWMEQTVARNDLPDETRAKALWALAACVYGSGDDERLMAISEEGVAVSRRVRDARAEAYLVGMGGFAALQLGDLDRATRDLEESLRLDRELGDDWAAAHILTHLAVVPFRQGNFPRVAAYAEEALELTERTGDRLAANIALYLLAQSALASGEHEQARVYFRDALVLTFEVSDLTNAAYCLQGLAAVAEAQGEPSRAATLLGAAEALLEAVGTHHYAQMDHELYDRVADAARERLGEPAWTSARREGRAMSFDEVVAYVREGDEVLPKARSETPASE
ncbi:MAG TPA: helix-turn-helix domain-containing protein [Rubrobacter sp.]|nr:helix-turn-helix domain-containing protein [Rubrobacter sp.]